MLKTIFAKTSTKVITQVVEKEIVVLKEPGLLWAKQTYKLKIIFGFTWNILPRFKVYEALLFFKYISI